MDEILVRGPVMLKDTGRVDQHPLLPLDHSDRRMIHHPQKEEIE
jgi:hypothetical protein